jgi:ABC-2 type transport system ATP-binding protein
LLVGFSKAPAISKLKKIKGVDRVEDADNGMFRFHFKDKYLPAEEIVNLSVKEGWGLYHINMDVTSLEETFVNLTQTS